MLVSLVMPIYNGENTLNRSIDSILNQSYTNYELILVNDGSVDNTKKICEGYANRDKRIKVVNKKNEGSGPSRNVGIKIATGNYIMFPDCDDWLEKTMIEDLLNAIVNNSVELSVCKSKNHTIKAYKDKININSDIREIKLSNRNQLKKRYIDILSSGLLFGPSDKMYDLNIIKGNNLMFPQLKRSQDIVFNINYIKAIDSMIVVNKALYNYRNGNINSVYVKFPKNYDEILLKLINMWSNIKKEWGGNEKSWNLFLGKFTIGSLYNCILNCFNPKYNLNNTQIENYINKLVNNEIFQTVLYKYHSNNKKEALFMWGFKNKKSSLLKYLVIINIFRKKFLV
jgi:glycosyltransferase involved in cell wall biosynthesis